jgi:glycosyltransferase involved in cell wall biosynthesis
MKVVWVIDGAYPLFGGAQITAHTFLRCWRAERGWEVLLATPHARKARLERRGVAIETYRDVEELKAIVRRQRTDLVLCSLGAVPDALRVAARFGIPSILYLHSFEYCPPSAEEVEAWGVSETRVYPSDDEAKWALAAANRLVVNSHELRRRFADRHGVAAEVVHPEIDPSDLPANGGGRRAYISGICGHRYKGAEVFLALADGLPRQRFLLVGDVAPALARAFGERPNIRLLGRATPRRFLGMSRIVLVPSLWPEPFGRIAVEAMASGIPLLASRVGGLAEIVGASALGVDAYRDPAAWAAALEPLLVSAAARAEQAATGRRLAAPYLRGAAARTLAERILDLVHDRQPDFETRVVAVCGGTARATAYSMVNARWTAALASTSGVRVIDVDSAGALARDLPDVTVHHNYGEPFATAPVPDAGRIAAVRTWDFGPYPAAWVERIAKECDLLLVYSKHVRRHAVASGIPARRVRLVPLGIDESVFTPEGPQYKLSTTKRFRFLFVGAPVPRKGADLLLDAYQRAFGPTDDVCLVIKDHPHDLFYERATIRERILEAARDRSGAEVEYICQLLPPERLAALYRTCDMGVFPYRAEGFCLPILEAMAAGLPSIVPRFGAALDYCSERTSLLTPVRRISLPVGRSMAINTLGFREEVDEVDFCETSVDVLAEAMRHAVVLSAGRRARLAATGSQLARTRFTWKESAARLLSAIASIDGGVPTRLRAQRLQAERETRRFEIAKSLLLGGDAVVGERRNPRWAE